jgi:hypothetical protein
MPMPSPGTAALTALCLVVLGGPAVSAAQSFDPARHFRTIGSPHFTIHFHEGEDVPARRLAAIAEETWRALGASLGLTPPPHTDVVLVDQTELANGWATPMPRDTIMVTAAWPAGVEFIGSTDDWLRVAFTHEFTHIVHLDTSRGWAKGVRQVFGRVGLAFPNTWLPTWQVEGLATFEESAVSHEGRLHAGDFRAIVGEAARDGRLEPLDRINGGLTAWPGAYAAYAYGLGFHDYLAERFGPAALGRLAAATSGEVPYFWGRAFTRVFGASRGDLWTDYQRQRSAAAAAPDARARAADAGRDRVVRLTHHGYLVSGPRITAPACASCPASVLYTVQTADEVPGIFEVPIDGSTRPARLTDRYEGRTTTTAATASASGGVVYFDQVEARRNAGTYSDLFAFDRATGRVRALTHEARLRDPDLSPDGRRIVAIRARADRRDLVIVPIAAAGRPLDDPIVVVSEPGTAFDTPRWSPDGRTIAVERERLGAYPEVVLVDAATRAIRVVAASAGARWVTPAWRPDGRAIVAAADLDGGPFNLYEIAVDVDDERSRASDARAPRTPRVRQITHTTGGATWPDVTADGQTIVFVGYTPDGFDLFRMPYRVDDAMTVDAGAGGKNSDRAADPTPAAPAIESPEAARPYSPWRTLAPTSWSPVIDSSGRALRVGGGFAASDVLGYHRYAALASWIVAQPDGTPSLRATSPDASASYAYTRWTVQPWIAVSRRTSFFGAAADAAGRPATATVRERQVETGIVLPVVRMRRAQAARVSFLRAAADITAPGAGATRNRSAMRASWTLRTAKVFGYSISPERGLVAGATAEFVRPAFGADARATIWTGDARAYLPGAGAHHVVAVRVAGGASRGDPLAGGVFLVGGAQPAFDAASFDAEAFSLLRGFAPDSFAGTRVAVANVDYRLPLLRPERGHGTLPIFLHTVHASIFTDVAEAWTQRFAARDIKLSAGAEISANVVLGYGLPVTMTAGAAWGHDGSGLVGDRWRGYVRIGRAF